MRRYITIAIRFGIYLVLRYPKLLWYRLHMKKIPLSTRYNYIRFLANKLNQRLRIDYEIQGQENLPEHNNLIFLPNHQSLFDTVLLYSKIPHQISFIAKKEVMKMPIIGTIAALCEVLLLDREDARSALKTLKMAANELKKDRNLLVFLEGTRTRTKDKSIGTFKNGGIRPAYVTQATLVPIVIDRSWEIFDKTLNKKRYRVQLVYLPPLKYEDYHHLSYADLAAHLQNLITDKLQQLRQENKAN